MKAIYIKAIRASGLILFLFIISSSKVPQCQYRLIEIHKGDSTKGCVGLTVDRANSAYAFNEILLDDVNKLTYSTKIIQNHKLCEIKFESRLFCLAQMARTLVVFDSSHIYRISIDGKILDSFNIAVRNPYRSKVSGETIYFNENRTQIVGVNFFSLSEDTILNVSELNDMLRSENLSTCKIEDFDIRDANLFVVASGRKENVMYTYLFEKRLDKDSTGTIIKVMNQEGIYTYFKSPLIAVNKSNVVYLTSAGDSSSIFYRVNKKNEAVPIYMLPVGLELEQVFVLDNNDFLICATNQKKRIFTYGEDGISNFIRKLYGWTSIYCLDIT